MTTQPAQPTTEDTRELDRLFGIQAHIEINARDPQALIDVFKRLEMPTIWDQPNPTSETLRAQVCGTLLEIRRSKNWARRGNLGTVCIGFPIVHLEHWLANHEFDEAISELVPSLEKPTKTAHFTLCNSVNVHLVEYPLPKTGQQELVLQ